MGRVLTNGREELLRRIFIGSLVAFILAGFFFPMLEIRIDRNYPIAHEKVAVAGLAAALKQYQVEYGSSPAGNTEEVYAALHGQNQRQIVFFEPSPESLNVHGELVDHWGTPYRLDISDPLHVRVWSCGPNRHDEGGSTGSDDITSWR